MKHYCTINKNITLGFVEVQTGGMLIVEDKRLKGVIGSGIDKFYRLHKKNLLVCVDSSDFLLSDDNSLTGHLQALKEKKIDVFAMRSSMHLYQNFTRISDAINEGSFRTGQVIKNSMTFSNSVTSSLHLFNIEIWLKLFITLAFFLTFIILFKLINVPNSFRKADLIGSCLAGTNFQLTKSMNAVSFVTIFYIIYFMILKSIISTNIKTNKVIVNTSHIIDDQNDLLNTKRLICYWADDLEFKLSKSAPKDSYLAKVFEKSKKNNNNTPCTTTSNANDLLKIDYYNQVTFSNELTIAAAGSVFSHVIQNSHYYLSKEEFYKMVLCVYFKRDIDEEFVDIPRQLLESGLDERMQKDLRSTLRATFVYRMRVFENKQEYVNEYSKISSLNFDYIKDSFGLILILNLITTCFFILNCVVETIKLSKSCSSILIVIKMLKSRISKIKK